jgi:hypothetical protein
MWEESLEILNRTCHHQQPLSPDYQRFADIIHDRMSLYASRELWSAFPTDVQDVFQQFMAIASLGGTKHQLDYGLRSLIAVATSMYFAGADIAEHSLYPRIIPKALAGQHVTTVAEIDTALFTRILRVDPWLSWTQRLRAQFRRDRRVFDTLTEERFGMSARYYQKLCDAIDDGERKNDRTRSRQGVQRAKFNTRRSILRATKLYGQLYGINGLQQFLAGKTLTFFGTRYDYRVFRSDRDLFTATERRNTGVIPLHLNIHHKNGDYLAPACLVFADTPLIDHLLHLRLMVQNPETEQKMLDALFIVGISNKLFDDPLAAEKGIVDAETAPTTTVQNIILHSENSNRQYERQAISETVIQHANAALTDALRYPDGYVALLQTTSKYRLGHYLDAMHGDDDEALLKLRDILAYFHALP